ncbi:hypothetical protein B0J14DRAFT_581080 [Halenospora varia]|nr:hypothetical protein B0J14DRAFT_581080 [Halenospora varia]
MLSGLKQRLWPSRQPEEDQNQEDAQKSNSPQNSKLAEEPADHTSPSNISTTKAVVELPSRRSAKRKQLERDIYNVPDSPDESEETNAGPSRKRRKGPKSKPPLIPGKKANGQSLPMPTRSESHEVSAPPTPSPKEPQATTRSSASKSKRASKSTRGLIKDKGQVNARSLRPRTMDGATKSGKRVSHSTTNAAETAAHSDLTTEEGPSHSSPLKKPRDRPPKNRSLEAPQPADELHEQELGHGSADHEEGLNGFQGNDDGITDILMNPSPVKVVAPAAHRPSNKEQATSSTRLHPPGNQFEDLSEDELEGQQPGRLPGEYGQVEEVTTSSKAPKLVDLTMLDRQIQKARTVGHGSNNDGEIVLVERHATLTSISGRKLARRVKSLTSSCKELRESLRAKDEEGIDTAYENIANAIIALQTLSTDIIALKLNGNISGNAGGDTQEFLLDFYFLIVPMFLEGIKFVAEVFEGNEMKDWELVELSRIVKVFCNLATAARNRPVQPKSSHNRSYQTSKPTRSVLPHLRRLLQSLHSELGIRKLRERQARYSMEQRQQEKLRKELEQQKERQKRRLINHIHLAQRQALERQYAEPVWGRIIQRNVKEMEEKAGLEREERHRSSSAHGAGSMRMSRTRSQESDPFEEDGWERVSVFGTNNHNGPRPWTGEQKLQFIDLMRVLKGPDRYERVANEMQCSMDEIFTYAKDLQDVMDAHHEKGEYNKACDDWTYDIWVTPD